MEITKFNLSPIERNGQRVLTTPQLAKAYDTSRNVISNNFNRNKDRFKEGVHYYRLTGEEKRNFFNHHQIDDASRANVLYLWTERGALLHAKSLNTEKAWEVFEFLEDNYFRTRKMIESGSYLSVQVIEKLEIMERKIDTIQKEIKISNEKINTLEKEIRTLDKNSERRTDNIIKTLFDMSRDVISNSMQIIYDKLFHDGK